MEVAQSCEDAIFGRVGMVWCGVGADGGQDTAGDGRYQADKGTERGIRKFEEEDGAVEAGRSKDGD